MRPRTVLNCWIAVFVVVIASILIGERFHPHVKHGAKFRQLVEDVNKVAQGKPNGIDEEEWRDAINLTNTALGNCVSDREMLKSEADAYSRFERMHNDLLRRTESDGPIRALIWVWDELEDISRNGSYYSQYRRPKLLRKSSDT